MHAERRLTSLRAVLPVIAAGFVLTGCTSPAASATGRPFDFRGTVNEAVGRFESDGFGCDVNAPANASLRLPSPVGQLYTASCRKRPPTGQTQGTFVTLYGLITDQSVVGIDILSDGLGSDPPSSPVVSAALASVFAPDDAAAVVSAIGSRRATDPMWTAVSPQVSVHTEAAPLLFQIWVWGPAVKAAHNALVAGSSASP